MIPKLPKTSSQAGFGLINVLIAVGILSVVMVGMISFFNLANVSQHQTTSRFNIDQLRRNLSTLISSDAAWSQMIANNASLACLQTGSTTPCNTGPTGNFALFTAGGTRYFDPTTQGFTFDGTICTLNTPPCPIQLTMQTKITCAGSPPAATCATPDQVVVTGTFAITFQPGQEFAFNPQNYLVQVRKDPIAAAGSGVVLQLKCGWAMTAGYSGTSWGASGYTPDPVMCAGGCAPQACPSGFTDSGALSVEVVGAFTGSANLMGNCVRTCLK